MEFVSVGFRVLVLSAITIASLLNFIFFLQCIINFFPLVRRIRNYNYLFLGPFILFSDDFFCDDAKEYRRAFILALRRFAYTAVAPFIGGIFLKAVGSTGL